MTSTSSDSPDLPSLASLLHRSPSSPQAQVRYSFPSSSSSPSADGIVKGDGIEFNQGECILATESIIAILEPNLRSYVVLALAEGNKNDKGSDENEDPDSTRRRSNKVGVESLFRLRVIPTDYVPQELLDRYLLDAAPDFLRLRHDVSVVVSTKSGSGRAEAFWRHVVNPLLLLLREAFPAAAEVASTAVSERAAEHTTSTGYDILVTTSADSVKDFARRLWERRRRTDAQAGPGRQCQTVILLSGDGGVVDLLNGCNADDAAAAAGLSRVTLPTIALLPLGTANALFHSLHKSLYGHEHGHGRTSSPLVMGLRTLVRGRAAPLPCFRADFPVGSRLVAYTPEEKQKVGDQDMAAAAPAADVERRDTAVSHLYGAIVASYGFHAQLVWESDTPEWRRHGDQRFGMVGAELLLENHSYRAGVEISGPGDETGSRRAICSGPKVAGEGSSSDWVRVNNHGRRTTDAEGAAEGQVSHGELVPELATTSTFNYILAAMVSNLERTFTISPASKPLDDVLRLVHFGDASGERTMEIMKAAYDGGKHVGMEDVGYDEVRTVTIRVLETDERWRKVCIDGIIVEVPEGGEVVVRRVDGALFGVLVDGSLSG